MAKEIWKPVLEASWYEVSSLQRVRRVVKSKNNLPPGLLKIFVSKTGYYVVNLIINGKRRTRKLHRLYAIAFMPNPNNYPQINHIDGNKLNNKKENLQWSNQKMNIHHAFRTGLICKVVGQRQSSTKLSDNSVVEIFNSKLKKSELSKKYKISYSSVVAIKNGMSWSWLTGAKNKRKYKKYDSDIICN